MDSQDPVAIDSVGFDFLWNEYADFPRKGGVDDYLHEAALALEKADVAFRLATKVRTKLVEAYQEVMRMTV